MNIQIKKLTPDLAEDYAHFFDITPHDDGTDKAELPCYCITWRSDDSYIPDDRHWFPTREERRECAIEYVKNGSLQGYLAYHGDEIVGWCNATADCQGGVNYLRSFWEIEEYNADIKVKSIFCFTIAPKVQRMGVATKLLEYVCKDSADNGFDFVEAYSGTNAADHDCRGHMAMYEKCGFTKSAEKDGRVVMRKAVKIEKQLKQIAKSYDRHFIEYGMEDSLSYDNLPEYITSAPNYLYWENECVNDSGNDRQEIINYLSPAENMNFIQLGCSMNLKTRGYDKWQSVYHGVDISSETIQTLNEFVSGNNISVGALHCGSVHNTPFDDSYFDIGECIGVLEYYERDFVLQAIKEFHRIMKPNGKFVLDIPNIQSQSGKMMMAIEECMGRPDRFDMLPHEFEDMIAPYFEIVEKSGEHHMMMYFYYLRGI